MNNLGIFILIAGLSPIPTLYVAMRRMLKKKTVFSILLFAICAITSVLEWMALAFGSISLSLPYIVDDVAKNLDMALLLNGLYCAAIVSVNVFLLLVALFAKRDNMRTFTVCMLFLFVIALLVIAIIGSAVTGRSIDECFFGACCGWLYVIGLILGFTYKEICVIVNIYLEAGICLLSILWVAWLTVKRYTRFRTVGSGVLMVAGILYGLAGLATFILICNHYAMPMNDAFDLCYRELVQLAKDYHTTYNNVNYAIFIMLFLVCTLGNLMVAKVISNTLTSTCRVGNSDELLSVCEK